MNETEEMITKYIFLKTGGFDKGFVSNMNVLEKEAQGGAIEEILKGTKQFFLDTVPTWTLGAGLGSGPLWWLLRRNLEKEEIKQRRAMTALNKQIEKAKGIS